MTLNEICECTEILLAKSETVVKRAPDIMSMRARAGHQQYEGLDGVGSASSGTPQRKHGQFAGRRGAHR